MSKITALFKELKASGKKGLIPFITAGDPDPTFTVELMHALVRGGANVIELGVPFSDPMADGPVIQRSSERALAKGVTLHSCLKMVKDFRMKDTTTPVVLMGYANPVEQMGAEFFATEAKAAGVDGVLVVDYPPEECVDFAARMRIAGVDPIFLLAPTSSLERIKEAAKIASGYIYYVSMRGVTGASHLNTQDVASIIPKIREATDIPIAVGFGINDAASAKAVSNTADAVVIGSRIIRILEDSPRDQAVQSLETFIREIRVALDS
ncbi:tryptophan synthase subunit alpha [Polynucleobacter sp. Latsch14-2]|jgi:tryptophan synthase alpha chain|uniref:tryptophan synthase subunit alpha n=1 Tax=Polynucleobacter sp. Latsch14-2 TaxID=2576920 RepID=UPI001C0BA3A2|nr:tryptophan synthase subunit alpha [Polynucleobacter sp. Latsch14-2]MBU3614616.1 tryptophan synthase subunit alpha [Polynucleobacter sp. Latsch14-2]